jgi:hypothetical protein
MLSQEDVQGTHMADPTVQAAWAGMVVDATPAFYLEHLKRLRQHGIQPYFVPAHIHQMEIIERLIRAGVYMGPLNMAMAGYGGGTLGRNPFHWLEFLRQVPQGAVTTFWASTRGLISISAMALILGQHIRVGNEDNIWGANRERATSVKQVEGVVRLCREFGRKLATPEEARRIMKVGVWYNSVEETLQNLGLPPNPTEYKPGFQVWETDGKKRAGVVGSDSHPIAYCMVPPDAASAVTSTSSAHVDVVKR